jgi:undecaprenyl-diphosphatase
LLDPLSTTILLGIIQGLAEWLPISSTAHLRIAEHFLGFQATPLFNVVLHAGTLAVVIFYFKRDIIAVLKALVHLDFHSEYGRYIPLIVIATIPAGAIGFLYSVYLADNYQTLLIIGITFLIGAVLVYCSKFGKETKPQISYKTAALMGAAQGAAVFPGLSRSGSTISTGLLLGSKREMVFKFSFLASIPAIIGDILVEAYLQRGNFVAESAFFNPLDLAVGLIVAALTGYIAIVLVRRFVLNKKFYYFSSYMVVLGVLLIIISILGY